MVLPMRRVLAGGLLILALVATGCADSDGKASDSSSSTTVAGKSSTTVAAKPTSCPEVGSDPVKVMVIAPTETSSALPNWPDVVASANAAGCAINQDGGIRGRMVEVLYCNERNDPNEAAACVRKADDEDVTAVIGQFSISGSTVTDGLLAAGIPTVGMTSAIGPTDNTSPNVFNIDSTATGYMACPAAVKENGSEATSFFGVQRDASDRIIAGSKIVAGKSDIEFVDPVTIPADEEDFAPGLEQLQSEGADSTTLLFGEAALQSVLELNAGKITPCFGSGSISTANVAALGDATDGAVRISQLPDLEDTKVPEVASYLDAMAAADARGEPDSAPEDLKSSGFRAFLDLELIRRIGDEMDGKLDAKSLTAALDKTSDFDLAGMTLDFTQEQDFPGLARVFNDTYDFARWDAGEKKWVSFGEPFELFDVLTLG